MSTTVRKRTKPRKPALNGQAGYQLIVNGQIRVPSQFPNLDAFRRWCISPAYPERGDVFWIDGDIWVSDEMEDFSTHNAVKTELMIVLGQLVKAKKLGIIFSDRMRLVHPRASLSVEPDMMFASFASIETKRLRMKPNKKKRILEAVGSPDMVLEIISDSSEPKDARLEQKYFAAGVVEYWRIDARGERLKFEILTRGQKGFVPVPRKNGRVKSAVFGREFELTMKPGLVGLPEVTLEVHLT